MKRRKFIKVTSAAMAINLFPLMKINNGFSDNSKTVVWESAGTPAENVKKIFSAIGGLDKLIHKDLTRATVLVKPNLCLPHTAGMGTVTSPDVVGEVCNYLIAHGVRRIIVADHTLKKANDFKNIELIEILKKFPAAKLLLANEQRHFQPVDVKGKVLKKTEILKMLSRVDLLINLATAKHHSATHASLAVKNLMGLIWNRTEFHSGMDLAQAVGDLALAIKPQLNIIDASRVLLKGGPTGPGPVITENRLFASHDILALDSVVVSRYNFGGKTVSAKEIDHLVAAFRNGVGEINLDKIEVEKIE